MSKLNIIIVWYNEEVNIPKMLKSIQYLCSQITCRIIYVDQQSKDESVNLMKLWWAEVFIHENKWYADPDKKRAVESLVKNDEWCFILDCDEEISKELSNEIIKAVENNKTDLCYSVKRNTVWRWIIQSETWQYRLFTKKSAKLTEDIHYYITPIDYTKNLKFKNSMDEIDKKLEKNGFISSTIEKNNRYSEKEISKMKNKWKIKIIFNMVRKPILRFFWFWIKHKLFFKWIKWLIYCCLMAEYQFLIYIKSYEKYH